MVIIGLNLKGGDHSANYPIEPIYNQINNELKIKFDNKKYLTF